jgi:methyl-accepting chemotaxis protein
MSDLPGRVGYTVMFCRMTATEMRKLAENTPEIARELRHIAEQVQAEAESLVGHIAERRR